MDKLQQVVAFFCSKYPYKSELSKARLTKLVYLADWFSSLIYGRQMTTISWVFNHYGPYVDDVFNSVSASSLFSVQSGINYFGSDKTLISYIGDARKIQLPKEDLELLEVIINKTQHLDYRQFIDFIYATYPVSSNERYSNLNLVGLAQRYLYSNSNDFNSGQNEFQQDDAHEPVRVHAHN